MALGSHVWLVLVAIVVATNIEHNVAEKPQVPCFFIFGDSLADNGNNNDLSTSAKVNYRPYGIDFPKGPTGRFTNGRTTADFLAELLGFEGSIPPFSSYTESDLLRGVNYASGSAGILRETGQHLGSHLSLDKQLVNHRKSFSGIVKKLGNSKAAISHLNKCLYYVVVGNNDYLNNYFLPHFYSTKSKYDKVKYADLLVGQLKQQLKGLYKLGARKFVVNGVGLVGCVPFASKVLGNGTSRCHMEINVAVEVYNQKLRALIDRLNRELSGAKFILVNPNSAAVANDPAIAPKVHDVGCCPVGDDGLCLPDKEPCKDRSQYTFWDSFHPTEAVNRISSGRAYKAKLPTDVYPMDISRLLKC